MAESLLVAFWVSATMMLSEGIITGVKWRRGEMPKEGKRQLAATGGLAGFFFIAGTLYWVMVF